MKTLCRGQHLAQQGHEGPSLHLRQESSDQPETSEPACPTLPSTTNHLADSDQRSDNPSFGTSADAEHTLDQEADQRLRGRQAQVVDEPTFGPVLHSPADEAPMRAYDELAHHFCAMKKHLGHGR